MTFPFHFGACKTLPFFATRSQDCDKPNVSVSSTVVRLAISMPTLARWVVGENPARLPLPGLIMGGRTQGLSPLGPQTYRGFWCPMFVSSQGPHHSKSSIIKLIILKFSFTSASEGYFNKITGVTEIWSYIFSSLQICCFWH